MSKYLSSLLGSQNIKSILGTSVSGIKKISGIDLVNLPLGTIVMYHGSGINAPTTKSTEISEANGDDFDMKGWYVCNDKDTTDYALGYTTDLVEKFIRMEMEAGNIGGNNDAPYIAHTHSLPTGGSHTHSTGNQSANHDHSYCKYWSSGGIGGMPAGSLFSYYYNVAIKYSSHSHTNSGDGGAHSDHSISNSGSSAYTDKNTPDCVTLIFLERLRIDDYKFPLGTVFMYHGTAISNIESKGSDLSSELGMPGWYVANGVKAGTVNMINRFARSKMSVSTGSREGSNNVTLRQHSHTTIASSTHWHASDGKSHGHYMGYWLGYPVALDIGSGGSYTYNIVGGGLYGYSGICAIRTDYQGSHNHTSNNSSSHYHTITEVGDNNGVGYNVPAYKTLIFIQKVEA
ncbi:MAG: hypothetical protein V3V14_11220 [Saprospiraceae bacterium]